MESCPCDYRSWDEELASAARSILRQIDDDMDPFYLFQLVKRLDDSELKRRIELELRMREGTARLLAAAKTAEQNISAAKSMLVSNRRMNTYTHELRTRKRRREKLDTLMACRATVAVTHLRIPLLWKNSDHFKNKGENRRFSVFCLISSGCEVLETRLVQNVDRMSTDIDFGDVIILAGQSSDFELLVELMVHEQQDEATAASLVPLRAKGKLSERTSSLGRSIGRKLSGLREDMENMFLGPKFERIAYTTVRLDGISGTVQSLDLIIDNNLALPLFGTCCFQVSVRPECMNGVIASGQLSLQGEDGDWCDFDVDLNISHLKCWHSHQKYCTDPVMTIPISEKTSIGQCNDDVFEINSDKRYYCKCDAKDNNWVSILKQLLHDRGEWGAVCELDMQIPEVPKVRHGVPLIRTTSLYDEVVAKAQSPAKTMSRTRHRRKSVR